MARKRVDQDWVLQSRLRTLRQELDAIWLKPGKFDAQRAARVTAQLQLALEEHYGMTENERAEQRSIVYREGAKRGRATREARGTGAL